MYNIALIVGCLYLLLLAGMTFFQRKLMYFPNKNIAPPNEYGLWGIEEHFILSEDGTKLHLWYKPAKEGMPTIVYFHGNAGHIGDRANIIAAFASKGLGVVVTNYRGYGKSEGTPDEIGIYDDARASIKWLLGKEIPQHNIAFYGESLGTGVAIKMATEFTPKALFLQAPYTSVVNRAAEIHWYLPVKHLIRDHFNSLARIKQVTTPLTIFHGRKDNIIPVIHGETLLAAANNPKQGIFFDDIEHNNFDNSIISQHVLEIVSH
jgi:fermentation-respiration switch protein FrsA (DUF1100 family)